MRGETPTLFKLCHDDHRTNFQIVHRHQEHVGTKPEPVKVAVQLVFKWHPSVRDHNGSIVTTWGCLSMVPVSGEGGNVVWVAVATSGTVDSTVTTWGLQKRSMTLLKVAMLLLCQVVVQQNLLVAHSTVF